MITGVYPLRFEPVYRSHVWGGSRIAGKYRRAGLPEKCAESWEISDRADGMSVVADGPLKGRTLCDLVRLMGENLLGRGRRDDRFPLLLKIIDARERLSIQVHPDTAGAARHGGEAKTEMWYTLDADPGARVLAGFKKETSPDVFRTAVENRSVQDWLNAVPVKKGSVVYVPGGRVHSIDAGCLLLEIQQNSDTTYRIYDWGRPRPLHLEQAMQVIRWEDKEDPRADAENFLCDFFKFRKHSLNGPQSFQCDGRSFQILFVEDGPLQVAWEGGREEYAAGTSILLPATLREWSVRPIQGPGSVLQISLP